MSVIVMRTTSEIGQRLAEIRQSREMTQQWLASAIGASVATVQNYERGRTIISADRILLLARALRCEPAELLAPPGAPLPRFQHYGSSSKRRRQRGI